MSTFFKAMLLCWFFLSQVMSNLTAAPVFSLQSLKAEGANITEQLSALNLKEQVRLIWGLKGNTWHFYSENPFPYEQYPAIRPLERLEPGYGYWIQYKDSTAQVPVSNSGPYKINILHKGYALIDPGLQTETNIESLFSAQTISSGNPADINEVWLWDSGTKSWLFHSGNPEHNSKQLYAPVKTLKPGQSFWIKTAVDGLTITPPGAIEPTASVDGGADELSAPLLSGLRISPFPTLYKNLPYPQKTDNGWLCEFENEDAPAFNLHYTAATEAGKEIKSITVTHRFWPATGPMQENILVRHTDKPVKTYGHISIAPSEKGLHHYIQTVILDDNSTLSTTCKFIVNPRPQSGLTRLFASMGQIQPTLNSTSSTIGTTVDPLLRSTVSQIRITVTSGENGSQISQKTFSGMAEKGTISVTAGKDRVFKIEFIDHSGDTVRIGKWTQDISLQPTVKTTVVIDKNSIKLLAEEGYPEIDRTQSTPSGYFVTAPLPINIIGNNAVSFTYITTNLLPANFNLKTTSATPGLRITTVTASTLSLNATESTTLYVYATSSGGKKSGVHKYEYWRTQKPVIELTDTSDGTQSGLIFAAKYTGIGIIPEWTEIYYSTSTDGTNYSNYTLLGVVGTTESTHSLSLTKYFPVNTHVKAKGKSQLGWEGNETAPRLITAAPVAQVAFSPEHLIKDNYFIPEASTPLSINVTKVGEGILIYTTNPLLTETDFQNTTAGTNGVFEFTGQTFSIPITESTTLLIYGKAANGAKSQVRKHEFFRTQRPQINIDYNTSNESSLVTLLVEYLENTNIPATTEVYISENGGEFYVLGSIPANSEPLLKTYYTNVSIQAYAISQYGWGSLETVTAEINLSGVTEAVSHVKEKTDSGVNAAYTVAKRLKDDNTISADERMQAQLIHALTAVGRHLSNAETPESTSGNILNKLGFSSTGRNIFNFTSEIARDSYNGLVLGDLNGIYEIQDYLTDPEGLQAALTEGIESLSLLIDTATDKNDTDTILSLDWFGETITFQKKDLFLLRSGFYGLEFAINFVSSHNFDLSDTTITTLLTNKGISGVTSLKGVIERYSGDLPNETETANFESIQLIDALKLEPTLLSLRTNGTINLSRARSSLINFLSDLLVFTDIIENLGGGSIDSAFYVAAEDMEDISTEKRGLLAAWNNLSGTYHANIGIKFKDGYLTGTSWYERILTETLYAGIESSITPNPAQFVFHEWIYSHEELEEHTWNSELNQPETFYGSEHNLIRANLNSIFSGALRDKILNGVNLSSVTSDNELENLHFGGETNAPSTTLTDLFPGGFIFKDDFYPREAFFFSGETITQPVELKLSFENFSTDWNSVQNIWIDFGHDHIQAIAKPSVPGSYTATLINLPLIAKQWPHITLEMTDNSNSTFYCMSGARAPFDLLIHKDYCWRPAEHWYADYAKDTINFKEPSAIINPTEIPGASISGIITATDGSPVAGVIVMLMYDDGVQRTDPAITNESGTYSFNDVPQDGSFKVQVFPSDPLSGQVPGYYNPETTGNHSIFPPDSMNVMSGNAYVYNLSIPIVSENNVIAGFVEDKSGALLSFDLTGYAEAIVNLKVYQTNNENMTFLFSIPIGYKGTDGTNPIVSGVLDDGFYAVPMPDGNYFLEVIADPPAYERSFYMTGSETSPSVVTVSSTDIAGANFALTESKGRISGTVNYAGTPETKGAKIILYEYDSAGNALKARATTSADSDGNYQFSYLPYPKTEYFVKAIPYHTTYIPGFYTSDSNTSTPSAPNLLSAEGVTLSSTVPYVSGIDFYLETGTIYAINGKVRDFNPSTTTFAPLNMQTGFVFMDVFSAAQPDLLLDSTPIGWREQTTNGLIGRGALSPDSTGGEEHGPYSLRLIPGNYFLRVRALDGNMNDTYTPFWYTTSGGSAGQTDAMTVSLLSGDSFGTDFNMLQINTAPVSNMEISGTIFYSGTVDQTNPARVFLYQYNDTNPANFTLHTTADINGNYIFHNVQPNTYVLKVVPGDNNYYSAYHNFGTSLPSAASPIFRQEAGEVILNETNTQAADVNFHLNTGILFDGYVKEVTDSGLQPLSSLSQWVSLNVANTDSTKTDTIALGWRDQNGSYGVLNDGFYSLTLPAGSYYLRVDADSSDPSITYPSLFYNGDTGTTDPGTASLFQLGSSGMNANFEMPAQSGDSTTPGTPELMLSSRYIGIQSGSIMSINFKVKPDGQNAYLSKNTQSPVLSQMGFAPDFSSSAIGPVTNGELYFQAGSFPGMGIATFNVSFDGSNYQTLEILIEVDPEMRVNLDGFGKKTQQLSRAFGDKMLISWATENQPMPAQLKAAVFSLQSDGVTTPHPVRIDGGDILISEDNKPLNLMGGDAYPSYDIVATTNGFLSAWQSLCPQPNTAESIDCIYLRGIANPETDPAPIIISSNPSAPLTAVNPTFLRKSESDIYLLWIEDNSGNFSYHGGKVIWDGASNLSISYQGTVFTDWTTPPLSVRFFDLDPATPTSLNGFSLIRQEYQVESYWKENLWIKTTNNGGSEPPVLISTNFADFKSALQLEPRTEKVILWTEKINENWDEELMDVSLKGRQISQNGGVISISEESPAAASFKQERLGIMANNGKPSSLEAFEVSTGDILYSWLAGTVSPVNFSSFSIGNGLILAGGAGKAAIFDNISNFESMQPLAELTGIYIHSSTYFELAGITEAAFQPFDGDLTVWTNGQKALLALNDDFGSIVIGYNDLPAAIEASNGNLNAVTASFVLTGLGAWVPELTAFQKSDFSGHMAFADEGNHRIVLCPWPTSEDVIIDLNNNTSVKHIIGIGIAPESNPLSYPAGIWTDGAKLLIADDYNSRIVYFTLNPSTGEPNTDGLEILNSNNSNLQYPRSISIYDDLLAVADTGHNRVLVYSGAGTMTPVLHSVIGQPDTSSTITLFNGPSSGLSLPWTVVVSDTFVYVTGEDGIKRYNYTGSGSGAVITTQVEKVFGMNQTDISLGLVGVDEFMPVDPKTYGHQRHPLLKLYQTSGGQMADILSWLESSLKPSTNYQYNQFNGDSIICLIDEAGQTPFPAVRRNSRRILNYEKVLPVFDGVIYPFYIWTEELIKNNVSYFDTQLYMKPIVKP
jgi:hypothetical protein